MPNWGEDAIFWLDDNEQPLTFEDGTPILSTETWLVLFADLPVITPRAIDWTVTFTVSVMP
ncbi:hypothetical protein [Mesorhizobium sp. 8]|uniref:hypothetical protein n=1 Tax=Mesorhizobium sp. 8 TaxID=2584466 RepID=UPI0011215612|nr:hypothetical protein [Mesorhizobium sp. 8]QDB99680.1 hypothetical protein FGU64_04255 [Mesorhizobium sp. 8]